jgi:hypothetical protein
MRGSFLFPDDLYQNSLLTPPVKLTVKDLFPGTEIQFSIGDGHDHFATHHLPFHVRIRIIFSSSVVAIP